MPEAKQVNSIICWSIPEELIRDPMVVQAENLTAKYSDAPAERILEIYSVFPDTENAFEELANMYSHLQPLDFTGRGVEAGAGVAILSSVTAKLFPGIDEIFSVEVVRGVVEKLRPRIVERFFPKGDAPIIDVVGSFDNMELEDESLDFAIEIGSLHHSFDLPTTLREINRVLKPGGQLLIIDRAHHDSLSDAQRTRMINVIYSREVMERFGFLGETLTRGENGEHEIRMSEWMAALKQAGFEVQRHIELRPTGKGSFLRVLKLSIPYRIRAALNILPTRVRPHTGELAWRLVTCFGGGKNHPVFKSSGIEFSVFLATKAGKAANP